MNPEPVPPPKAWNTRNPCRRLLLSKTDTKAEKQRNRPAGDLRCQTDVGSCPSSQPPGGSDDNDDDDEDDKL